MRSSVKLSLRIWIAYFKYCLGCTSTLACRPFSRLVWKEGKKNLQSSWDIFLLSYTRCKVLNHANELTSSSIYKGIPIPLPWQTPNSFRSSGSHRVFRGECRQWFYLSRYLCTVLVIDRKNGIFRRQELELLPYWPWQWELSRRPVVNPSCPLSNSPGYMLLQIQHCWTQRLVAA